MLRLNGEEIWRSLFDVSLAHSRITHLHLHQSLPDLGTSLPIQFLSSRGKELHERQPLEAFASIEARKRGEEEKRDWETIEQGYRRAAGGRAACVTCFDGQHVPCAVAEVDPLSRASQRDDRRLGDAEILC